MNKQNMSFCMFVFLILVVSFTGCESKPPKSVVANAVFALQTMVDGISSTYRGKLTIKITNSFSREVEVPTFGKEKHHFFVSDIVWKSKEIRDNHYRKLISDLQKEIPVAKNKVPELESEVSRWELELADKRKKHREKYNKLESSLEREDIKLNKEYEDLEQSRRDASLEYERALKTFTGRWDAAEGPQMQSIKRGEEISSLESKINFKKRQLEMRRSEVDYDRRRGDGVDIQDQIDKKIKKIKEEKNRLDVAISTNHRLIKEYEAIIARGSLNLQNEYFKNLETTLVRRGDNWYSLSN